MLLRLRLLYSIRGKVCWWSFAYFPSQIPMAMLFDEVRLSVKENILIKFVIININH